MKFLSKEFSPASCHFVLGPNIFRSTLFSDTLSLCSSLETKFDAYKENQVPHWTHMYFYKKYISCRRPIKCNK
jgi:hypothetical protein